MTNVVVFSGGRGATTILNSLARTRNVRLSVVINGYDSGLSTGRVRRVVKGMLGPSDLRKTSGTLAAAVGGPATRSLAALLETRIAEGPTPALSAEGQFADILEERFDHLEPELQTHLQDITLSTWSALRESLTSFQKYLASTDQVFDYNDLALGNAVLAGMFVNSDFNVATSRYQHLLGLKDQHVLNVTNGEDLWLTAAAGDFVCPDEGALVSEAVPAPIDDLYLLSRVDRDRLFHGRDSWWAEVGLAAQLSAVEKLPRLNVQVAAAIEEADVIVYGPGTQHSSLFPSYLTAGLGEAIRGNTTAEKVFVANIGRDTDQHSAEGLRHTLEKFHYFMSLRGRVNLNYSDLF